MNIQPLIDYYETKIKPRVFFQELLCENNNCYILFTYNYENELENFKKTFMSYLPFYIKNQDKLDTLDYKKELGEQLEKRTRNIENGDSIVPKRIPEVNGLFGELFLDFYLRIVRKRKLIITYASKRPFNSNYETSGPDNLVYGFDDKHKLHVYFCEAKFVGGKNNAKRELLNDINGSTKEEAHICKEYLNKYIQFVVNKKDDIDVDDKEYFNGFLDKANDDLQSNIDFVSILNQEGICVDFVFFAIFDSVDKKSISFKNEYEKIYLAGDAQVKKMNLNNTSIEVVFIPVDNKPLTIKKEMVN